MYDLLRQCRRGGRDWTRARWEKLNEAFGEGWEKECFPYLETGTWGFQPGHQYVGPGRDEAQWDAILEAVKLFKRTHGSFPRYTAVIRTRGGGCTVGCRRTWTPPPATTPTSAPTSSFWPSSATAGRPSASSQVHRCHEDFKPPLPVPPPPSQRKTGIHKTQTASANKRYHSYIIS